MSAANDYPGDDPAYSGHDFVVSHQTNALRAPDAWDGLPCCICGRDLANAADDYDTCENCRRAQ